MTSAIVLAGYSNKREVKKYSKVVAEHYGEVFVESGYKPLREFAFRQNGKDLRKPVIQFTLEELAACDLVDEIVIIGHRMLLEQRLGGLIATLGKPCTIANQNARLPSGAVDQFKIDPKKIKFNSMAGNMIKGYAASTAYQKRDHALFVASDSPLTSLEFIENFIHFTERQPRGTGIICPAIVINAEEDRMGRKPLKLLNDSDYPVSGYTDNVGRYGFRLSSLLSANLYHFDLHAINTAYSLRKLISPKVQLKLFRTTRNLGYKSVYSTYFRKKNLSVTEIENIASTFIDGRFMLVPMAGEEATYDYDGTDGEYRSITEMLKDGFHTCRSAMPECRE